MSWSYAPVWDVRRTSLARFRLVHPDQPWAGDRPREDGPDVGALFDLDEAAVAKATEDLAGLASEDRAVVVCTVHAASLAAESRRSRLLQRVARAPAAVRRGFAFEVLAADLAPAAPTEDFIEAAADLRLRCGVAAPLADRDSVENEGDSGDTAAAELRGIVDQPEALSRLTDFARRCARRGQLSVAYGLDTSAFVLAAAAAGVRLLSGRGVHEDVQTLDLGRRFTLADMYARRGRGGGPPT
ncbi:MAG TPA: hypothetical protein VF699_05595 [Caulobacteraceae bacterium]